MKILRFRAQVVDATDLTPAEIARRYGGITEPPKGRECSDCGSLYRRPASAPLAWLCTRCTRKAQGLPRDVRGWRSNERYVRRSSVPSGFPFRGGVA